MTRTYRPGRRTLLAVTRALLLMLVAGLLPLLGSASSGTPQETDAATGVDLQLVARSKGPAKWSTRCS